MFYRREQNKTAQLCAVSPIYSVSLPSLGFIFQQEFSMWCMGRSLWIAPGLLPQRGSQQPAEAMGSVQQPPLPRAQDRFSPLGFGRGPCAASAAACRNLTFGTHPPVSWMFGSQIIVSSPIIPC